MVAGVPVNKSCCKARLPMPKSWTDMLRLGAFYVSVDGREKFDEIHVMDPFRLIAQEIKILNVKGIDIGLLIPTSHRQDLAKRER